MRKGGSLARALRRAVAGRGASFRGSASETCVDRDLARRATRLEARFPYRCCFARRCAIRQHAERSATTAPTMSRTMPERTPQRPLAARAPARPQPRRARAPGRDRQLVRAPAGQALRRGHGRLGDGVELRCALRQREDDDGDAAHRARRAHGRAGRDPALRPGARRHAQRGGDDRARHRRGLHRPQHGLSGAEGLQDRRRSGADRRPRPGRRGGDRGPRRLGPAGDGEDPQRAARRRPQRLRAGPPARRRSRRRRDRLPSALGAGAPQGRARPGPRRASSCTHCMRP